MRVALNSGAYYAASLIAGAQRCVNLYPEVNPKETDSPTPLTHYPCPGLELRIQGTGSTWRGGFEASNGVVFGVLDETLYIILSDWTLKLVGDISPVPGMVSMVDNGIQLLVVTGPKGFTVDLETYAFLQITDPFFQGASVAAYIDTFCLMNVPDTRQFISTLSNQIEPFDNTYIASKTSKTDLLQSIAVVHKEVVLIGKKTSEFWYDSGNPQFPFEILPGVIAEQGTNAKYSVCTHDIIMYMLSQNKDGQGIAVQVEGYEVKKISTPAIEAEWSTYSTLEDAIGMTYSQRGHTFYFLVFPTADKTWVFDINSGQWHERVWIDSNGVEHRHRANCIFYGYGKILVGDHSNGKLYSFSLDDFSDDGDPMTFIRSFPHLMNDGKRVAYDSFIADLECGNPTDDANTIISLRWSDNRGKSYGNALLQAFGARGDYLMQPQWSRLGMGRDRVFELSWSTNLKTGLNGAFVEMHPSKE